MKNSRFLYRLQKNQGKPDDHPLSHKIIHMIRLHKRNNHNPMALNTGMHLFRMDTGALRVSTFLAERATVGRERIALVPLLFQKFLDFPCDFLMFPPGFQQTIHI